MISARLADVIFFRIFPAVPYHSIPGKSQQENMFRYPTLVG